MSRRFRPLVLVPLFFLPARTSSAGELGLEMQVGYFDLAASRSANAVFGSSGGATVGGGARWVFGNSGKGLFVSAGARTFSKEGERVFLASASGPIAKLGFPLSVRITPIFATAGWRFAIGKSPFVPYAGLGLSRTSFKEESEVAGELFEESRSETGFQGLAGLEYGRGPLRFGAEFVYSRVPDAVGLGGVSKVYGEDDIGGLSVLGKVVFAF